jgi:anti-sigma regulatory factor (Ser/Thr protein kinase)
MSPSARRLLLHHDLTELERLAVWIEGWAMRELSASLSFAVQVCLEEAVANIIMYSTAKDDRLEIVVEVERRDQTLVARIEDNGSAFDPTQVPRPPVPASLGSKRRQSRYPSDAQLCHRHALRAPRQPQSPDDAIR